MSSRGKLLINDMLLENEKLIEKKKYTECLEELKRYKENRKILLRRFIYGK